VPLYEYECDACGRRFEMIRKFSDPPLEVCKECGKGPIHKLISSPAIQFKGSGWYITDYAQKGKSDSSSSVPAGKTSETTKSDSSGDSGQTEKKSETKSETKRDGGSSGTKAKE
jgi:putative FmdB family regulatory protein